MRIAGTLVWPTVIAGLLLVASPATATFPGANGKITFSSSSGIETMEPDGSNRALLSISPAFVVPPSAPAWSADGKKIAFIGYPTRPGPTSIFISDADGSNVNAVTGGFSGGFNPPRDPAWSRDSSKLAFTVTSYFSQGWATELDLVNADGTGLEAIREVGAGRIAQPNWSPVGDEIAYVDDGFRCDHSQFFPSCDNQIWIIGPDGTQLRKLGDDKGEDFEPSWSQDGTEIAFTSTREPGNSGCLLNECRDIYTMNADGTGAATRLTNSPGTDTSPVWSPDGKRIAFVSTRDGNSEIYVMNADGSGQTNLTNTPGMEDSPDWQALPLPTPADFKNAAQFCKAERARLGDPGFRTKYENNGGCVRRARR